MHCLGFIGAILAQHGRHDLLVHRLLLVACDETAEYSTFTRIRRGAVTRITMVFFRGGASGNLLCRLKEVRVVLDDLVFGIFAASRAHVAMDAVIGAHDGGLEL